MSTAITKQGGGWAIAPANMGELFSFAKMLAESDLVPKDYRDKPGNCMVAIQMGGELGLSPMQSIQNIAVINGRPTLWGDGMLGVCLPHLDKIDETDDGNAATCTVVRGARTVVATFSMEDAERAGLQGKAGPWKQYPARMRKMRARGFALRDICADVLRGIISAEEVSDYEPRVDQVRAEVVDTKTVEAPPKAAEPKQSKPVGPVFWLGWPDKAWAGRLLTDAPSNTLCDYIAFLEALLADPTRERLHKGAASSRDAAQAVIDDRMAAEAEKARAIAEAKRAEATKERDPIAEGLQAAHDAAHGAPSSEDGNASWGLEAPQ